MHTSESNIAMLPLNSVVLNVHTLPADVLSERKNQNVQLTTGSFHQNPKQTLNLMDGVKVSYKNWCQRFMHIMYESILFISGRVWINVKSKSKSEVRSPKSKSQFKGTGTRADTGAVNLMIGFDLQWPSMTFYALLWQSMPFDDLMWFSSQWIHECVIKVS